MIDDPREYELDSFARDDRALAMCDVILFALASTRSQVIYDRQERTLISSHDWFREVLRQAGYGDLPQVKE